MFLLVTLVIKVRERGDTQANDNIKKWQKFSLWKKHCQLNLILRAVILTLKKKKKIVKFKNQKLVYKPQENT